MNPTLLLACGSLVLSSAPLLVRASSVGPTATGAYRCLLAVPMIALWLLARRQSLLPVGAGRRYWTSVIGAGTVFACDLGLWHRAIHFAGPGLATVLANTQVFFTGAFGVLFFGERAGRRFWLSTLGAFGGMAALVWRVGAAPTVAEGSRYWAGVGMGIVAAFCYSLFIILLRRSAVPAGFRAGASAPGSVGSGAVARAAAAEAGVAATTGQRLLMVSLVTGAVMTVVALLEGDMGWPGLAGLAPLAALAFLPQTLGWLVITANLPQVRVGVAGLVLLLQPILSVLLSRWIFNEVFQPHQVAGAIVTLASVYVGSTRGKG